MAEQTGALELLCSPAKILRDRGIIRLKDNLKNTNDEGIKQLEISIRLVLNSPNSTWERKHGALMGFKEILMLSVKSPTPNIDTGEPLRCSQEFTKIAETAALEMLTDSEARVRLAAGEVMGCLCERVGASVYISCKDIILEGVLTNLERQPEVEPSESGHIEKHTDYVDPRALAEKLSNRVTKKCTLAPKPSPAPNSSPVTSTSPAGTSTSGSTTPNSRERKSSLSSEEIFHDTAGWKALETWMTCLKSVISGCGSTFNPHVNQTLINLIFKTLDHTNRFVRETGYYVLGSLVACNYNTEGEMLVNRNDNAIYKMGDQFSRQLATGLADNWSQVRLAASMATRQFLLGLSTDERDEFFSVLLPPLCLNRYYVAEGVRIYNQQTWRTVVADKGCDLVQTHIGKVVEFYILQTEADNHAVREAACACIAELASKVDPTYVREYVPHLLDALLVCFKDESWPVRDAACVACGDFIKCFPDGSRPMMESLYQLFFMNLEDSIASVRQGAAIALHNVLQAYGDEALVMLKPHLIGGLKSVKEQKITSAKYFDGPGNYGVVKKLRDNDESLHTDKQMYSCGSLAPKMHKGKRGGGCMDHQFRRESEPWETTDGCIRLISELSKSAALNVTPPTQTIAPPTQTIAPPTQTIAPPTESSTSLPTLSLPRHTRPMPQQLSNCGKMITELIPLLIEATDNKEYTQHVVLLETICNEMVNIGKGIGKKNFKMYSEQFIDSVLYAATTDNGLTKSAAKKCLNELSTFLGPSILRAKIEMRNKPRELEILDESLNFKPFN